MPKVIFDFAECWFGPVAGTTLPRSSAMHLLPLALPAQLQAFEAV